MIRGATARDRQELTPRQEEGQRRAQERAAFARSAVSGITILLCNGSGASAGGLGAFEAFFSGMPLDTGPGMAMAQDPESTEYDGMPRSAIATGMVDYDAFGNPGAAAPVPRVEDVMKKLFIRLRSRTGHDFSLYKPNTIQRRVKRRMSVHQIDSPEEYVEHLRETPAEAEALFRVSTASA